jgi:hypothetical protein
MATKNLADGHMRMLLNIPVVPSSIMNLPKSRQAAGFLSVLALLAASIFNAGCGKGGQTAPSDASPSPTATPIVAAASPASPTPDESLPKYSGAQQSRYIAKAEVDFMAQRDAKFEPFLEARNAFETAGGILPAGLTPAGVVQRLDLLSKVQAAHADYLAFITNEADAYRAALAKTPLIPADVDANVTTYAEKANIPREIKAQELERDLLACSNEMLSYLQKQSGAWEISPSGKLAFKKKADKAAYIALEAKYNGIVVQMNQLHPAASPAASVAPAASPAAAAAPSAPSAPSATP